MNTEIKVIKTDGSKVSIDLDKIHRMVEKSCRGITEVIHHGDSERIYLRSSQWQLSSSSRQSRSQVFQKSLEVI